MSDYKATVGNVELVSLSDGLGDREPVETFPDSTIQQWRSDFPELLDSDGLIHPRYGTVAVRSGGRLIVVDTGLQAPDGTLLEEMRQRGVDRQEVDIVVMTHLHRDHVGWNLTDGSPSPRRAIWSPGPTGTTGLSHRSWRALPTFETRSCLLSGCGSWTS